MDSLAKAHADCLAPLVEAQTGVVDEREAVASPGSLRFSEAPLVGLSLFERQVAASPQVGLADFDHSPVTHDQSLRDFAVRQSDHLRGAQTAETPQNDMSALAPTEPPPDSAEPFLAFEGQSEADVLLHSRAVVSAHAHTVRTVDKVASLFAAAVQVGAEAGPWLRSVECTPTATRPDLVVLVPVCNWVAAQEAERLLRRKLLFLVHHLL